MGIFGNAFTGWHAIIILVVIVLLFGAAKLPALAKSVGQSMKIFKSEIKTSKNDVDNEATSLDAENRGETVTTESARNKKPSASTTDSTSKL